MNFLQNNLTRFPYQNFKQIWFKGFLSYDQTFKQHQLYLGFPFAKLLRNFCGTKRKIFLSLRISFARKNNNLHNHSQKSFRAKLPYSAFAKLKFGAIPQLEFCAIPQFRTKIRNRLSSKSLDNFSFGHAFFLKVDSSGVGYFLALFYMRLKRFQKFDLNKLRI